MNPSSQQQGQFLELLSDSVMIRTMDGRISSWNRSATQLYGWGQQEAIGRISHDLLKTQFPKPLDEIESDLVRHGRWEGQLVHATRDGGSVVVQSRWALNFDGPSEAVIEINKPSVDRESAPNPRTTPDNAELATKTARSDAILSKIAKAGDFVLVAGSAFACAMSLYVIYYYSLSGQRELLGTLPAILYSLPAGISVLLFSALWWKPEKKINLAIVFVSCAVSVYTTELILRLRDQPRPVWLMHDLSNEEKQMAAQKIAKQFHVEFDIRDRLQVIDDFRKRGIDTVPGIIPRELLVADRANKSAKSEIDIHGQEVIPLGGVSNKGTVLCNESGPWITYVSDDHGFNNPAGIWRSGSIDVAALGDSFTQGYCVAPEKSFVGLIRGRYPATLNLGMAGNGPLYTLASLEEFLPSFKPKVVLWFYFEGNDLAELQIENKSGLLKRYLNGGFRQGLNAEQDELDQALQAYIASEAAKEANRIAQTNQNSGSIAKMLEVAKLDRLRKRLGLAYGVTPEEVVESSAVQGGENIDLFGEVLSRAKAEVDSWGGKLYFVYLPSWGRYSNNPETGTQPRARVLSSVMNLGIPILDMHPAFAAQDDPLALFPFRGSGHYNAAGHELVGREILNALSDENSLGLKSRSPPIG